jgi:hypothetical protein
MNGMRVTMTVESVDQESKAQVNERYFQRNSPVKAAMVEVNHGTSARDLVLIFGCEKSEEEPIILIEPSENYRFNEFTQTSVYITSPLASRD